MTEAEGANLFRTISNEQNTTVLPDEAGSVGGQGVYTYLQRGLEEFSRQVGGYVITDGTVTVGTSGIIALPTDFVDVIAVWITSSSAMLGRTSQEDLLSGGKNWLTQTSATPEQYAVKGTDLLIYKKPTGSVGLTVRYVATPGAYTSAAFTGILEQDHPLPVYYAAALYIQLHNDVPEMQARAKNLMDLFYKGCEGARPFYARKLMPARNST